MIRKTIIEVNKKTDKMALPKIPVPSDRTMELSRTINLAFGSTLITLGLVTRYKWLIALGATSIAVNQFVTNKE